MDITSYVLSKKIAASAVSGVNSMSVDGTNLNIVTNNGDTLTMSFPTPKDGVSVVDIDINENSELVFIMSDGTEIVSGKIEVIKGDTPEKGVDYWTDGDKAEIIEDVKNEIDTFKQVKNLFNKDTQDKITNAYYSNGKLKTDSNFDTYFIEVTPGCEYHDRAIVPDKTVNLYISFFDKDKKYLSEISKIDYYTGIIIPNDSRISYIGIPVRKSSVDTKMFIEGNYYPSVYIHYGKTISVEDIVKLESEISSINITSKCGVQWKDKTWYSYGTSLTSEAVGKYVPYVGELGGFGSVVNKGIGGGGIVSNTRIKDAVMNTTDGKLGANLITLEVGANDTSAIIGTIYDTGDDTFCGALNQCIRYLQQNTNAQIVVLSSTNSRYSTTDGSEFTPERTFGDDNHTKYDQWKAIEEVCKINSVYYIPMGENAGLGYARMSDVYQVDNIHHTDVGGYNLAQFVWSKLKDIPLWYTEVPTE